MISWHKIGQKVTLARDGTWAVIEGSSDRGLAKPVFGRIYTVADVALNLNGHPAFVLAECDADDKFVARAFRPVYPDVINQLRTLPSIAPERVKEDA